MRTVSLILWWICTVSTWTPILSKDINAVDDGSSSDGLDTSTSSDDDNTGNDNTYQKQSWGGQNEAIFPLPVTTWSILQLNESARSDLCRQQTSFCEGECGGTNQATLNFCNQTTMAWGCRCQNKVPDCAPYQWPMTAAECHGRENSCKTACSDPVTQDICFTACSKYYRCNRPGGLPSLLQTNSPSQQPVYDPPPSEANSLICDDRILFVTITLALLLIF